MKRALILALSMAMCATPVLAQDSVPYAYRPLIAGDTWVPDLGYIMADAQVRHIKLWLAGKDRNWELADYELNELLNRLNESARLYRNIPIEQIEAADQPIIGLKSVIKEKAAAQFDAAFSKLTASCNTCHHAANLDFVVIKIPTSSPFTDQSFTPPAK